MVRTFGLEAVEAASDAVLRAIRGAKCNKNGTIDRILDISRELEKDPAFEGNAALIDEVQTILSLATGLIQALTHDSPPAGGVVRLRDGRSSE